MGRHRDLLLRRGKWRALPVGGSQSVAADGQIRVLSGGAPAGQLVLGYGKIRKRQMGDATIYSCDANVISAQGGVYTGNPDCPGESVVDCKSLDCEGLHCKGQDCGEFSCDTVSCKGAECGDFSAKIMQTLSSEMQSHFEHPFVKDLRTQLEIDDVRRLAAAVRSMVSQNIAAR